MALMGPAAAATPHITIGWAKWGPADALLELSRDFTAETGIEVRGEFIPWPIFQERVSAELNASGDSFDLLVGDSQWLGGNVQFGHYVELTDFFAENDIDLEREFAPLTVAAFSEWPKRSKQYWSLPTEGDAVGWSYRKDWFERPDLKAAFKADPGYDLAPPANWLQLRDIARFFEGREIDGKKVNGISLFTGPDGDGITMGVTSALYAWGVAYETRPGNHVSAGAFNSPAAAEALAFYRDLYECCTPRHQQNVNVGETFEAFRDGQVAMAMNFFAFFPLIEREPRLAEVTGYFANPAMKAAGATLGGQGMSIVSYSQKQDMARMFLKWFARADIQKRWWQAGGFSCHNAVLNDPDFDQFAPYARGLRESLAMVRDFWQSPHYRELLYTSQQGFYDYVVGGRGDAPSALDEIGAAWTDTFGVDGMIIADQ
jgi:multiple sugar transport system substrate-binding protein